MAAAPDPKGLLVFAFQHNENGTINVDKSLRSFFNQLCTRRRITAAAAKTTHKRTATTSVNSTIQMALLKAIKLEDKLKHLVELEEVVANEGKYGVISAAESDFVLKLSCAALLREISIIIRSEVKAVAGAARRPFMVPDPLKSLASHVVAPNQGSI